MLTRFSVSLFFVLWVTVPGLFPIFFPTSDSKLFIIYVFRRIRAASQAKEDFKIKRKKQQDELESVKAVRALPLISSWEIFSHVFSYEESTAGRAVRVARRDA